MPLDDGLDLLLEGGLDNGGVLPVDRHAQPLGEEGVVVALGKLGFEAEEVEEVRVAGLLHDIGMIGIREAVVHKRGQLSEEEYGHVQEHVEIGADILQPLAHIGRAIEYVRCHHERINGSGYPRKLTGSEVPLGAQIVGLAEAYVSLTEERAFREAYPANQALETLQKGREAWFEGQVVDALGLVLQG